MSKFDISKFSSELSRRRGAMKTNKYRLVIPPPPVMVGREGVSDTAKESTGLHFWASDVQLPGYQLVPGQVRRWTYGPVETRPIGPNFQQIQANFVVDGEGFNWKYFSAWMQAIIPHDAVGGGIFQESEYGQGFPYELEYKDNYATDPILTVYADDDEKIMEFQIREAFPSNINAIPLSWGDRDNLAQFSVFFEYLDFQEVSEGKQFKTVQNREAF